MDRQSAGVLDSIMRVITRKNSVYVAFIFAGALIGERVIDYSINKVWEMKNEGKRYEDIPVLGSKATAEG